MKPGLYTVESWNNKDAVLIGSDGEFLCLTKSDFPSIFGGQLFVGEKIEIFVMTVIQPLEKKSLDERARASRVAEVATQQQSQKLRDFVAAENERRMRYGVKPL